MADIQKKEPDHLKEAKKLFDSYSEVLKHKLGRNPTLDEIVAAIKTQQVQPSPTNPSQGVETLSKDPATSPAASGVGALASPQMEKAAEPQANPATMAPQEGTPKVFRLQILYGLKDDGAGNKQPDPSNPLFYTDGQRHFDCSTDEWMDQTPPMADHLMSRPMQHDAQNKDLFDAIMHGVLDEEDFGALDQAGMIDDRCHKLHQLMGNLNSQYGELNALAGDVEPVQKTDLYDHLHSTDDSSSDPVSTVPIAHMGDDDVQEKINTPQTSVNALADLLSDAFGPGVDPRTVAALRQMIQEEIRKVLDNGLEPQ